MTLISGYQSTTVTNLFQYDPSLNPTVVSLSRNRTGIAGEKAADVNWTSSADVLFLLLVVGHRELRSTEFGDLTLGFFVVLTCSPCITC